MSKKIIPNSLINFKAKGIINKQFEDRMSTPQPSQQLTDRISAIINEDEATWLRDIILPDETSDLKSF
jgi:hypothetical protein